MVRAVEGANFVFLTQRHRHAAVTEHPQRGLVGADPFVGPGVGVNEVVGRVGAVDW